MSLYSIPSFSQGFARNASQSLFPNLRKGSVGLWAPYVGVQGQILYDWSGNRNNGVLTNMTNNSWVPGKDGWALDFVKASNNYIDLGEPAELDFTPRTDAFSIVFWAKLNDDGGIQTIIAKSTLAVGSRQYDILIAWSIDIFITIGGSSTQYDESVISDDTWHHWAIIVPAASSGLKLYIDGNVQTPTVGSGAIGTATNSEDVNIGRESTGRRYIDGLIGSSSFYSRVLLPQEIALLYAIPHAPLIPRDDLMAFLVAAGLSRYHDLSGLGAQGQMTWNPLG